MLLLVLVTMALTFFNSLEVEAQGYLRNLTNNAVSDTINTQTANDTSYVFKNTGYSTLQVELYQNSVFNSFRVNISTPDEIRLVYVAADSTLKVEKRGYLGWIPLPIVTNSSSTNAASFQIPLRAGTAILSVYGKND